MKPEVIPIAELTVPEGVALPDYGQEDIYKVLARKVRRGIVITGVLFGAGLAVCCVTLIRWMSSGGGVMLSWAAVSFAWAVGAGTLFNLARMKLGLARRIAADPGQVFWAHPTLMRQNVGGTIIEHTFITLHMRTGKTFEVGMSRVEMCGVVAWLRKHNPEVRLGAYDGK